MSDIENVQIEQADLNNQMQISADMLRQAGDALSRSLSFSLRRDFLSEDIFKRNIFRAGNIEPIQLSDITFLEINQVGKLISGDPGEYMTAIQTTLAACHDPRYNLVFIISSDGINNKIYLAIASREAGAQPKTFAEQIGHFLASNWPGTQANVVSDYEQIARTVHIPLSKYRFSRAFTGIPSYKKSEVAKSYPQNLDRLMRGLRGKPFIYMVIAEPMPEKEVNTIIDSCNTLSGQVHAFIRTSIQRSINQGVNASHSRSESTSTSNTESTSESESVSTSKSKGALGAAMEGGQKGLKAAGLGAASALLAAVGGPFLLSGMLGMFGQLFPTSNLSESLSSSATTSKSESRSRSNSKTRGLSQGESLSFGRDYLNKHAESCENLLSQTVERFKIARAQGSWNVGVYMIGEQEETAAQGQAQLKALVSGDQSTFEPIRAHDMKTVWNGSVQVALDAFQQPPLFLQSPENSIRINHPIGDAFEKLTTPMNTEELSYLINLPLDEMPGISIQPTAYFSLNPPVVDEGLPYIDFGNLLEGGKPIEQLAYKLQANDLTRHVFITGITGSGKSNTCRGLLTQLLNENINFMVIEPAKDEYARLALQLNEIGDFKKKINVYMPGRKEILGNSLGTLHLNPFDIIRLKGSPIEVMPHMDRLKSILNASFPMYEIMPVILEEALVDLYDSQGWIEAIPPEEVLCPTIEQLNNRIANLVASKGYEERITANITAAMQTRFGSLMRGWKGDLFNIARSTPWAELFDQPTVVNLSLLGDDADKCFTMALLLNFMYEYRRAQFEQEGGVESSNIRHVAIFEEAHRILKKSISRGESSDPAGKMSDMFSDILAEIRAYGQGMVIIDQVPSKLIPDALKNTNLKIVHRLVSGDDRDAMSDALALTDDQKKVIARLKVGQAIIGGVQDDTASWVGIHYTPIKGKSVKNIKEVR